MELPPIMLVHWTENMLLHRRLQKSGSLFFNYKKSFSIVLLALCDAYQFTAVDIGEAGRQSDGGVFADSNLGCSIVNDYFNLSQPKKL